MARGKQRPDFLCSVCGMNLGPFPWKGRAPDLYTECGCFRPIKGANDMRVPSQQEKVQAILDTVPVVAEYLKGIDRIEAFNDFTKDDICGLIRACQDGVQASLHRQLGQSFDDQIPF